jgi:hypothetical protein
MEGVSVFLPLYMIYVMFSQPTSSKLSNRLIRKSIYSRLIRDIEGQKDPFNGAGSFKVHPSASETNSVVLR